VQEGLLDLFFQETINCEKYVQAIFGKFFQQLTEEERLYGWFQQDSATAHTACMALSDVFEDRSISSNVWPVHSPDLNLCDFFFHLVFEGQNVQQ
jgi:hypothetical protein